MPRWSRRSFVAASAVGLGELLCVAHAADVSYVFRTNGPRLFETGPLSRNSVAQKFERMPPGVTPPHTTLIGASGKHSFSELRGKTRIVSLWAEWCVPCLSEMPDLLRLQQQFAGAKFEVLAILTASFKKLDLAGAIAILGRVHADVMPLWIEPGGGRTLFDTLASPVPKHGSLPCTLLIDARGRLRGRVFGMPTASVSLNINLTSDDMHDGKLTQSGKAKLARAKAAAGMKTGVLSDADKSKMLAQGAHSLWSTPDGAAFAKALANGALD